VRRHQVPLDAATAVQRYKVVRCQRITHPAGKTAPGADGRGGQQLPSRRLVGRAVSALGGWAATALAIPLVGAWQRARRVRVRAAGLEAGAEGHGADGTQGVGI
jgi:hypothetical protein